jgi:phage/plasmid-like protein (TIGR03299 family)
MQMKKIGNVVTVNESDTPWKANGVTVDANASLEEWQKAAKLDYQVIACPSLFDFNGEIRKVPNRVQLVRSDTGVSLSEMSGNNYKIRQPSEILEFFRNLVDGEQLKMKVVGSMQEGRKIFALAERIGSEVEIGKGTGDILRQNVFLIESFDGSHATKAKPKAERLFCLNQIETPFSGYANKGDVVKRKHSQEWEIQGVQMEMAAMDKAFASFVENANNMTQVKMTEDMVLRYFSKLYAPEAFENPDNWRKSKYFLDREEVTTNKRNVVADLMNVLEDSLGHAVAGSTEGTLYGALNAVTFYHDHEARTKGNKRFESAMIGAGNRAKDSAYALALEVLS